MDHPLEYLAYEKYDARVGVVEIQNLDRECLEVTNLQ